MVTYNQCIALVLCLIQLPYFTTAFLRSPGMRKRFHKDPKPKSHQPYSDVAFTDSLRPITIGHKHESLVIECEAQGIPAPTVHWLKNGVRMTQGYSNHVLDDAANFEDHTEETGVKMISVSSTKSRLLLDCLTEEDAAHYTCVAVTPYLKITQNTTLNVKPSYGILGEDDDDNECERKKSRKAEPARIHMWTVSRLEYEDLTVQLFCRAQGYPEPLISWYDRNNDPIEDGGNFQLLDNGDLIIKDISWFKNMGVYTCLADNGLGTDTSTTFLYPAARD